MGDNRPAGWVDHAQRLDVGTPDTSAGFEPHMDVTLAGRLASVQALVVVPTYNERDNLPRLVERLMEVSDVGVLVVDDGSPDGTGALADDLATRHAGRVAVLHRTGRRGLGLSYIDGIRTAIDVGAPLVCQMDADFSHSPDDVPRLIRAAAEADVVIGSRYVTGGRIENWPLYRKLLSAFANRYIRTITGVTVNDCTSGFRCWRRETLLGVPFERFRSDNYAFLVELLWEAVSSGARVSEVPITFVERREGVSKLSTQSIIESARLPWRLAARRRLA